MDLQFGDYELFPIFNFNRGEFHLWQVMNDDGVVVEEVNVIHIVPLGICTKLLWDFYSQLYHRVYGEVKVGLLMVAIKSSNIIYK